MGEIRVALIDDSSTFLAIAARFLAQLDSFCVVGAATSAQEALDSLHQLQPDVMLVDLAMPEMPGLEVIPLIREAMPDMGIIALSLLASEQYRSAALQAGADDFVGKADLASDLPKAIQRAAEQHRRPT